MDKTGDIREALGSRILILDGAMGTMLQKHALSEQDFRGEVFRGWDKELKGNNDCLNLTRPDIIRSIHEAYINAGADIIETNTFSSNIISQSEYGCEAHAREMALQGARIARQAADAAGRKVWVAGSIGPTGKSLTLASDLSQPAYRAVDFDQMAAAYREQIEALRQGGVDFILAETCFDALNVKAAIYACQQVDRELPMMISAAVSDRSGRTLTGQTLEAFYTAVRHAPLLAFGLNCSFGAAELQYLLESVADTVSCPVSFYPNAGLPNELGQYDETPEIMAEAIGKIARKGLLNIVGGCCGTSPEHIRAIAKAVQGISPRELRAAHEVRASLTVSGLECATIDKERSNFTNIGERTNVAGSAKFKRLIASGAYDEALQVAADQIEGGASIIDINMDDAMLDSTAEMEKFLRHIANDPAVSKAALMIDSSHFDTIIAGLKNAQGKCIVNSISLKEGEQAFVEHVRQVKDLGAAIVVMAFDEVGQATTCERKIEICERAYRLLTEQVGFAPNDIIFDVNVLSIGTGMAEHARYGIDFIEAVRWIKTHLPGALTSGGISNLSFAFRGNNPVREAMHSAFLYHATSAGLDMGIVNPGMLQPYDDIEPEMLRCVEDVIMDKGPEATERLIDKAQETLAQKDKNQSAEGGQAVQGEKVSASERLTTALVKGQGAHLQEDVMETLRDLGRPVDVIEGPLMAGMETVGQRFGEGKMFLPQVVKSAKIMRDAVSLLQPFMEAEQSQSGTDRPRIVIATVKGDVHDIGKNITGIVLSCNGFDVTDIGVMVPNETILAEAERLGADIVAASGLITPSLARMEELCSMMAQKGMTTPLFIGGATTSALHTAVRLAPLYEHVFYGQDASSSAVMAKRYMMDPDAFEAKEHEAQQKLRDIYYKSREDSQPQAEKNEGVASMSLTGRIFSDIAYRELGIDELMPYFDWSMLYAIWGIRHDSYGSEEALRLKADAQEHIAQMKEHGGLDVRLSARFIDAVSDGDDIIAYDNGQELRLPMLRQSEGERLSLADYLIPKSDGRRSQIGVFAISVHRRHHAAHCDCGCCGSDSYESMLERTVRLTMAEAASSWLDHELQKQLPSDRSDVRICKPAAGYSSCPDHTMKHDIMKLMPCFDKLDISFTESYAMIPDASICGFIFAHPRAGYPDIRKLPEEAVQDYARRRSMSEDEIRLFLGHLS